MSHLHKKVYKDNQQLIPYINGFLWPLEILNEDFDHGQTYYVEEIERVSNYEESIKKHLLDPNYVITLEEKVNWRTELELTSISFFESILNKVELNDHEKYYCLQYDRTKREIINFVLLNEKYISLMIMKKDYSFCILELQTKMHYYQYLIQCNVLVHSLFTKKTK